jgi:beta-lactamase regulating signal transducer with metallopeptidase domain
VAALVLETSLATAFLAVMAAGSSRLLRRRPALCHVLWLVVLLRFLVPSVPLTWLGFSAGPLNLGGVLDVHRFLGLLEGVSGGTAPGGGRTSAVSPGVLSGVGSLALGVWLAGGLGLALSMLRRRLLLRRLWRLGEAPPDFLAREVAAVARRLSIPAPEVRTVRGVASPFVFGLRPRLVWPHDAAHRPGLAGATGIRTVLAHELAHVARRDCWVGGIESLAVCLWWWNPLFWLVLRQERFHKEAACDAWALRLWPGGRRALAESLVAAGIASPGRPGLGGAHLSSNARGIQRRVRRLYGGPSRVERPWPVLLAAALLGAATLPGLAERPVASGPPGRPPGDPAEVSRAARVAVFAPTLEAAGAANLDELGRRAAFLLEQDPRDGRAWAYAGIAAFGNGDFEEAVGCFLAQYDLGHVPTYASYNAACCYALMGRPEEAIEWLGRSLESGFEDLASLREDPDLAGLHGNPAFERLLAGTE